jgi:hypothetical protein
MAPSRATSGAAPAPESIAGSLHDHLVQPRVEPGAVTELGKVAPGRHRRLLNDVVRIGLAAEDRGGSSKGPVEPRRDQGLECIDVAACGPLDEVLVAKGHHAGPLRHVHTITTTADRLALGTIDPIVAA